MLLSSRLRCVLALGIAFTLRPAAALDEAAHGAWTLRCEAAAAHVECILLQNLVLGASGQTVLQFAIGYAPGDTSPTVLMSLPLGISLPPGVTIRIDDGKTATFPVERCEPAGCRAGMKLRRQTIDQLSAGRELTITFYDGEREAIEVPLSLDGFSSGFAALVAARGD